MPRDDTFGVPRPVRQAVKREYYSQILEGLDPEKAFDRMMGFTIGQLIDEDPDLTPLEPLRDELVAFAKRLRGEPDAFDGQPWARFPCELVKSGTWADLTGGERSVYVAVLAIADGRTLMTFTGLRKIAKAAGLTPGQTSRVLTSLKRKGLIARWQQRHGAYKPFFTRVLPRNCFKNPRDAHVLDAAATPRRKAAGQ